MFKQLILPLVYSEPTDFSSVKITEKNLQSILWLKNWNYGSEINFTCLIGSQSALLASVWSLENQAHCLSNGRGLIKDWYSIMDRKYKPKCYTMINPEFIEDEEVFLYIINFVKEHCFLLLLASDISPSKWHITLPDLKSRILTMNVFNC